MRKSLFSVYKLPRITAFRLSISVFTFLAVIAVIGLMPTTVSAVSPPTVTAGPDASVTEGSTYSGSALFEGDSAGPWNVSIDYGDGTVAVTSTISTVTASVSLSHTYLNDGLFPVVISVDDGSETVTGGLAITVTDVAPVIAAIPDATLVEGQTFAYSGSFSDPGTDTWSVVVDWGDGSDLDRVLTETIGMVFSLSHVFPEDGDYSPVVSVIDRREDGSGSQTGTTTFSVSVSNILPSLASIPNGAVAEGSRFELSGSFTDPEDTLWDIIIDWGDSSGLQSAIIGIDEITGTHTYTAGHVFSDPGTYSVIVTLDDGTDTASETFDVVVSNVAPTIDSIDLAGGIEGTPFGFNVNFSDAGSTSWTVTLTPGDGGSPVTGTVNAVSPLLVTYVYADNPAAPATEFTATIAIVNSDGESVSQFVQVPVANADPEIIINSDGVIVAKSFTRTASLFDLGVGDGPWGVVIDFGDGSGPTTTTITASGASLSLAKTYLSDALYTVTLTATDTDGGTATGGFQVPIFTDVGPDPALTAPTYGSVTLSSLAQFTTDDQDIWGPVTSGTGEVRGQIFYNEWSGSSSSTDIDYNVAFGWDFGVSGTASANGHIGMFALADDLKGTVSVDYRPNVSIDAPQTNAFLPGQSIPLPTWWELDDESSITPGITSGDLSLWGQIEFDAYIGGRVCVFSCASTTFVNIDTPASEFEIIRMPDESIAQTVGTGILAFLTGVNLSGDNPSVEATDVTTASDIALKRLVAQGEDNYASIIFDLDAIARKLGVLPFLGAELHISNDFNFGGNLFDAKANIKFWADQTLTFEGQPVITLNFNPAVVGVTGDFLGATTNGTGQIDSVTYLVGNEVRAIFPADLETPVQVTPVVYLENSLTNDTDLFTKSDITLKALDLFINLKHFKIFNGSAPVTERVCVRWNWKYPWNCTKRETVTIIPGIPAIYTPSVGVNLGPVWGPNSFLEQVSDRSVMSDGTFSLEGFNPVTLNYFFLNPEIPPVAAAGGPYFVDEGSTLVLDGSGSYDQDLIEGSYVGSLGYQWSSGTDFADATLEFPVFTSTLDDSTVGVELTVTDNWNAHSDTAVVTVLNVAPDVASQGPATLDEGSVFTRLFSFTDPGLADTHDATVDWGDTTSDNPSLALGDRDFTLSHVYADNGAYTVSVTVVDDDGGSETEQFVITVTNVNPTVDAGLDREWLLHELAVLDPATFNDLGTLDTHTALANWDNGDVTTGLVTESPFGPPGDTAGADGSVDAGYIYRYPGTYSVTVTVEDDDLGIGNDTVSLWILGAKDLKARATGLLAPFAGERQIEHAIRDIGESLTPAYWVDLAYLNALHGHRVFTEEKQAVIHLVVALDQVGPWALSSGADDAATEAIYLLVQADQILAESQIFIASGLAVWSPESQNSYDRLLEMADQAFERGDTEWAADRFIMAIDLYRLAWKFASLAESVATGNLDDFDEGDLGGDFDYLDDSDDHHDFDDFYDFDNYYDLFDLNDLDDFDDFYDFFDMDDFYDFYNDSEELFDFYDFEEFYEFYD